MPRSRICRAGALGALLCFALVASGDGALADDAKPRAPDAPAAAFNPKGEDWEGLAQLVRLAKDTLGPQRVVVTPVLPLGQLERDDALLIVHPTRALDVDELEIFMRAGGRIVLLDDYGTGDGLLTKFRIQRVPMPDRPAQMLRGNPVFAVAEPSADHPAVRDVAHVVTNHATGVEQPALQRLLVVHAEGEPDGRSPASPEPGRNLDVALALAGVVGQGRLVAVGDASIPINSMLRFPGNRALALGLVRYAAGVDGPSDRHGKLYILANDFETAGSFGTNSTLAGAAGDARRAVSGALETLRREGMPPLVALVLALLVGVGIVAWTTARAGRTYRPTVLRFIRPIPLSTQGGVAGRAASLGLPRAPRAEVVVELKRALEDALAARIPLEMASPAARLVDSARQIELLGPDELAELGRLMADLRNMETALVSVDPARASRLARRVRTSDVLHLATRVQAMLAALGKIQEGHAGSPQRVAQSP
jgi:hypothetical protein